MLPGLNAARKSIEWKVGPVDVRSVSDGSLLKCCCRCGKNFRVSKYGSWFSCNRNTDAPNVNFQGQKPNVPRSSTAATSSPVSSMRRYLPPAQTLASESIKAIDSSDKSLILDLISSSHTCIALACLTIKSHTHCQRLAGLE